MSFGGLHKRTKNQEPRTVCYAGSRFLVLGSQFFKRLFMLNDRLLKACRRQEVDRTPIWLMRQAGRYLPEFRALRQDYDFLTRVKTPEIAAELTLQPVRLFDLDAAIIFSDIIPPLEGMGFQV